jgi:hypothetical protein
MQTNHAHTKHAHTHTDTQNTHKKHARHTDILSHTTNDTCATSAIALKRDLVYSRRFTSAFTIIASDCVQRE